MTKGISETDFAGQVYDLLNLYQWRWIHQRPAWSERGWRTPIRGNDPDGFKGKGLPDIIAVRPPRLLFIELKDQYRKPTLEQDAWLEALKECQKVITTAPIEMRHGIGFVFPEKNTPIIIIPEVYLWRPSDIEPNGGKILETLR